MSSPLANVIDTMVAAIRSDVGRGSVCGLFGDVLDEGDGEGVGVGVDDGNGVGS